MWNGTGSNARVEAGTMTIYEKYAENIAFAEYIPHNLRMRCGDYGVYT
jgi:hypothetical protein